MHWYCGHLNQNFTVELSRPNPGLFFGATLFTTLRVYNQSLDHPLTAWQSHCDRLQRSVSVFQWLSPNWVQVRIGAEHLIPHYPVLRITLFPDGAELITGRSLPPDLYQQQHTGIVAWLDDQAHFSRSLPGHKTGNYLPCWQALQTAQRHSAQEAIFVDSATGTWLETNSGNLWGWADGCWWTPPLYPAATTPPKRLQILPGIVRSHLIHELKCQNREVKEEPWTHHVASTLEALAYCNSVKQIVPIHTVLTSQGKIEYNAHHPSLQELFKPFRG